MRKIAILSVFIVWAVMTSGCGSEGISKSDLSKIEVTTELDLSVDSTYSNIDWKEHALLSGLPNPNTQKIEIESEDATSISLIISDVSQSGFETYANMCKDKGFNINFSYSDDYFTASSLDGYNLTLYYKNDIKKMDVYLYMQSEIKSTTATEKKAESTTKVKITTEKSTSDNAIRSEVKKTIDTYEAFMNKYVAFMKKYSESNDTASMVKDYAEYMGKYTELVEKFNALENNNLNDSELKYYLEIQNKINTELLTIE